MDSKFAHRTRSKDIENFYKIMNGEKKIITKKDEYEFEASYMAMCLLLPKEFFMKMIDLLGGAEKVITNSGNISALSRFFNVEGRLIRIRIKDLYEKELEEIKIKKLKP